MLQLNGFIPRSQLNQASWAKNKVVYRTMSKNRVIMTEGDERLW